MGVKAVARQRLLSVILGPLLEHQEGEGVVEAALTTRLLALLAILGSILLTQKIAALAAWPGWSL